MRMAFLGFGIIVTLLGAYTPARAEKSVKNSAIFIWNLVKQHPFLTAAIIVISLQEEPLRCIKDIAGYFFEEYPLVSIIVIALLLGGYYQELSDVVSVSNTLLRYTARALAWILVSSRRVFGQ